MFRNSDFLTVATISHVPQALVTINSARRYAPTAGYHLFVLDATADTIKNLPCLLREFASGIHIFGPYDLGPEQDAFLSAFKYYNAVELSCLAKYVGLAHVFRTSSAEIYVYADSDILILQDFREAVSEIGDCVVLATPHQMGCTSDDKEHEFLLYGWLNAGFFCIQRHSRTRQVLDWLIHRISRRGFYAPDLGMSADQTWFSALPFVFQDLTKISRHPGMNVGYWNLEQRRLSQTDGAFRINGSSLLAFHFSGFDRAEPAILSKYSDLKVVPGSLLNALCKIYVDELDAIAPLKSTVAELSKLACSRANLNDRMLQGSIQNELSLVTPSAKSGLFSRFGRRADWLLSKILARLNSPQ